MSYIEAIEIDVVSVDEPGKIDLSPEKLPVSNQKISKTSSNEKNNKKFRYPHLRRRMKF